MAEHFYLSAESSYQQGRWKAYPYQVAIMDVIGNDDIRFVTWKKAARTGYTKIVLGAMAYFAQHKRRNQAIWQPTDDDADEFVKTELDPMLRDIAILQDVFPVYLQRSRNNSLRQKLFLGSTLHIRGGKAAKNYRRLTVDVAILDELDGFDIDVEKEGTPDDLAAKRTEGANFPKIVKGSTPKLKGFSLIETAEESAELQVRRYTPCPHCDHEHPLTWGGPKANHGMKWTDEDPDSVAQLCPACGALYTQSEYLAVWDKGRWIGGNGVWIDEATGEFKNSAGEIIRAPESIAFCGLWTAYSPQASWVSIVKDWLIANKRAAVGDTSKLKTFTNTTLGETWEEEAEKADGSELAQRAEDYPLRTVPFGGLVLVAGVDVQDNRFEAVVWAVGRGEEQWVVDYTVLTANPADERDWEKLDAYLLTRFPHASGQALGIEAAAIDTGGHFTHQVYNFCRTRAGSRRIYAIKGDNRQGQPVKGRSSLQDVNWMGKVLRHGVRLWHVGVNTAKDLIYGRIKVTEPGPGRLHFSRELTPDFYAQLTAESRVLQKTSTGEKYRWIKPSGARNEVLDCTVYALFAAQMLDLHRYTERMWTHLEAVVQPATRDLFADPIPQPAKPSETTSAVSQETQESSPRSTANERQAGGFGRPGWHL